MITLGKSPQNDGGVPASKTQVIEFPMLLLNSWIELFSCQWCALAGNSQTIRPCCFPESVGGWMMMVEWCRGVFHPRDQAVEQGEWMFHH
jgi:hypothetical protein